MENNFNPSIYKESIAKIKLLLRNQKSTNPTSEVLTELNSINHAHTEFIEEYVNSMESEVDIHKLVEALNNTNSAISKLINNEIENIKNTPHQKIIELLVHAINNGGYEVHKNYRDVVVQVTENATPEQLDYLNRNTGVDTILGVSYLVKFAVDGVSLHVFTDDGLSENDKFGGELRLAMISKRIREFEELYKDAGVNVNTVLIGRNDVYRTAIHFNGSNWDTLSFMTNETEIIPDIPLRQGKKNIGIFDIIKIMDGFNRIIEFGKPVV